MKQEKMVDDKSKKLANTAAAFFEALADFLKEEAKAAPAEAAPAPAPKPPKAAPKAAPAAAAATPKAAEVPAAPAANTNGKDDPGALMAKVRDALSEYAKTYGREGVRAMLDKHGAVNKPLSDVPLENLPVLLAEVTAG